MREGGAGYALRLFLSWWFWSCIDDEDEDYACDYYDVDGYIDRKER